MRSLWLVALALALVSGPLRAAGGRDPVAAEALFAAGRAAFDQGDYATACAKFSESQRLDPAPGTLMNLATCNEKRGRLASAWENWREALSVLQADDDRRPAVQQRIADIEARVPRLDVRLAPGAPAATTVTRDGIVLGAAALGVPLPVDPGPHVVVASAPGHAARTFELVAEEGRVTALLVEPGAATAPPEAPASPAPAPPPSVPAPPSSRSGTRTLGLVLAGVGIASLVVGGVTGALALADKNTIEEHCTRAGERWLCDQEGVSASHSGETFAALSSVTFPLGLALGTAGTLLFLSSPERRGAVTATAFAEGVGFAVRGRF